MILRSVLCALLAVAPQSAPQAGQAQKLPAPDEEAMKTAEKKVREAFKQELAKKGAPERTALANKFILQAAQTADDAAVRYVLLSEARSLATQAGDLSTALRAIEEQGRIFDIVASTLKADVLGEIARTARTPEIFRQLALRSMDVAEEAATADQYDSAVAIVTKAETFARNTKDALLIARLGDQARDLKELKKEADSVKGHLKTLSTAPDDPAANLAAGRFYCVVKGDWTRGLPLLVKGSDSSLQEIAQWESVKPTKADNQIALADAWWEQARKQAGLMKARYQGRAVQWYQEAAFGMTAVEAATALRKVSDYEKVSGHIRAMELFADFVSRLPAEEQLKRVMAKLKELNPGFDGKETHLIESESVVEFTFATDLVSDIWPVRSFRRLRKLGCGAIARSTFNDLTPLRGLRLKSISMHGIGAAELSPLLGMQLEHFASEYSQISDLTPLAGMPIKSLHIGSSPVTDITAVRGMPLDALRCGETKVSDLSPLAGLPLTQLSLKGMQIKDLSPLKATPLKELTEFVSANPARDEEILKSIKTLVAINGVPPNKFFSK